MLQRILRHLRRNKAELAIVDMGSNGIRFGIISSLDRHLPVLFEERASISLFAAQFSDENEEALQQDDSSQGDASKKTSERQPISEEIIVQVENTFKRWKELCDLAKVKQVRVIATEATRTAPNSEEFQKRIYVATGWKVDLLSKAEEANIGAMGVMASYHTVKGLFMDLGGGSVQLNYIVRESKGGAKSVAKSSDEAKSWPYGAAALSKRLNDCGTDIAAKDKIFDEMKDAFAQGLNAIGIPDDIEEQSKNEGGYRMYLSGGGFRALGYLLMARKMDKEVSKHGKNDEDSRRYPIPIINGFMATREELEKVVEEHRYLAPEEVKTSFRVSKRRAKMIPACAMLMAAVMDAIKIKEVLFSEGGVRQGKCFSMLKEEVQNKDPAVEAVKAFVKASGGEQAPLTDKDIDSITHFVSKAVPTIDSSKCPEEDRAALQSFIDSYPRLIPLLVMVMNCYIHVLAERHEGDLADPDMVDAVKKLIPGGKVARQVVKYLGGVLGIAGLCAPFPGMATKLLLPSNKYLTTDSTSEEADESLNQVVILSASDLNAMVAIHMEKSHRLLVSPVFQEAIEDLGETAKKFVGFTGEHSNNDDSSKGKGKGKDH
ncbi:hypothetical protein BGZ65_000403 [Modicella reniformis]|uniref:Ppx/GppA phosphatase N-terminal domain-containing protein n=1 Tax=Modicella reniformis TaxID=1440133 RepID=A0A9P6M1C7_9FUNG|nr:hypothetical protein BGZ65_000403 [Modicella reniformis]